ERHSQWRMFWGSHCMASEARSTPRRHVAHAQQLSAREIQMIHPDIVLVCLAAPHAAPRRAQLELGETGRREANVAVLPGERAIHPPPYDAIGRGPVGAELNLPFELVPFA